MLCYCVIFSVHVRENQLKTKVKLVDMYKYMLCEPKVPGLGQHNNVRHTLVIVLYCCHYNSPIWNLDPRPNTSPTARSTSRTPVQVLSNTVIQL